MIYKELEQLKKILGLYAVYQIRQLGAAENSSAQKTEDSKQKFLAEFEVYWNEYCNDPLTVEHKGYLLS